MSLTRTAAALALATIVAAPLTAQDPTAPASDYRSETLQEINTRAERFLALAEAIPADKYTWRPAEGVRSVSEVLLHVATANYGLTGPYGAPPPEGIQLQALERSTTEKAAIIQQLRASFDHLRRAVENAPADAEATHRWFGGRMASNRAIGMSLAGHLGEHLGQLIAYARVNGVRPPWSGEG